ncbi:Single-stranded DNA-binding protein [Dissulfuribacter thermophilus]|uniref:Single-stranded DNA-binding protein n=1 Tax=Dissulfuribacter thermophilus TaxID=1156395 RepID=A0A1B9F8S8_9BACT|nr:single-stranded DNA-binding protein [Dissulfuribacter thermophilus]OCC16283.1 Single-stranded DNA-binding protein [Dissulfuribacter thermophilus]
MARGVNKVILIGRLGADPEIRYTQTGMAVASFRIATNNRVKRGEEWVEEPEWHRIVAWDKLAEICSQYLKKGMLVYIEGQLRTRAWEDQDGNRRWTTEVHAREMQMLESKGSGSMEESELEPPPIDEDDVPF